MSCKRKQKRSPMFCNSMRRICRNPHNLYTCFFGRSKIHVVKTCTAQQNYFYSTIFQNRNYIRIYNIVYKNADCIKAFCSERRFFIQLEIKKINFITKFFIFLCKGFLIIGTRVKKSDFTHVQLLFFI